MKKQNYWETSSGVRIPNHRTKWMSHQVNRSTKKGSKKRKQKFGMSNLSVIGNLYFHKDSPQRLYKDADIKRE